MGDMNDTHRQAASPNISHLTTSRRSFAGTSNDVLPKRLEPLHTHNNGHYGHNNSISYDRLNRRSNSNNDDFMSLPSANATTAHNHQQQPLNAHGAAHSPSQHNKTIAYSPPQLSPSSSLASLDGHYYESDTDSPLTSSSVRAGRSFSVETRSKHASSFDFVPMQHNGTPSSSSMHHGHKASFDHSDGDRWSSRSPSHLVGILFLIGRRLEFEASRSLPSPISYKSLNEYIREKLLPMGSVYKLAGVDDKTRPVAITDDGTLQRVLKSPPSSLFGAIIHCEVSAINGRFSQMTSFWTSPLFPVTEGVPAVDRTVDEILREHLAVAEQSSPTISTPSSGNTSGAATPSSMRSPLPSPLPSPPSLAMSLPMSNKKISPIVSGRTAIPPSSRTTTSTHANGNSSSNGNSGGLEPPSFSSLPIMSLPSAPSSNMHLLSSNGANGLPSLPLASLNSNSSTGLRRDSARRSDSRDQRMGRPGMMMGKLGSHQRESSPPSPSPISPMSLSQSQASLAISNGHHHSHSHSHHNGHHMHSSSGSSTPPPQTSRDHSESQNGHALRPYSSAPAAIGGSNGAGSSSSSSASPVMTPRSSVIHHHHHTTSSGDMVISSSSSPSSSSRTMDMNRIMDARDRRDERPLDLGPEPTVSTDDSERECIQWARSGVCPRGSGCPFVHKPRALRPCKFFLRGYCVDPKCEFSHHPKWLSLPASPFDCGLCAKYFTGDKQREQHLIGREHKHSLAIRDLNRAVERREQARRAAAQAGAPEATASYCFNCGRSGHSFSECMVGFCRFHANRECQKGNKCELQHVT